MNYQVQLSATVTYVMAHVVDNEFVIEQIVRFSQRGKYRGCKIPQTLSYLLKIRCLNSSCKKKTKSSIKTKQSF